MGIVESLRSTMFAPLHCVWQRIVWNTVKMCPNLLSRSLLWREPLEIVQSEAGTHCSFANWLASRLAERFPPALVRDGWPNYTFAFHDGAEIGPPLLARIAKNTGLRPEDICDYLLS